MGRKKSSFQWSRDDQPDDAREPGQRRDKTKERAENQELDALALRLSDLTPGQRRHLPVSEQMLSALDELVRLRGNQAHRRQLLRVQGMLRDVDTDAIEASLKAGPPDAPHLHATEQWRTRLLAGDDDDLQAFVDVHPGADRQALRTLIRQARGESASAPRAARRLFQALKQTELAGD